jgi:hypothetical protein
MSIDPGRNRPWSNPLDGCRLGAGALRVRSSSEEETAAPHAGQNRELSASAAEQRLHSAILVARVYPGDIGEYVLG